MKKFITEYMQFECPVCKSKLSEYKDSDKEWGKQSIIECKNGCYHIEGQDKSWLIDRVLHECGWDRDSLRLRVAMDYIRSYPSLEIDDAK